MPILSFPKSMKPFSKKKKKKESNTIEDEPSSSSTHNPSSSKSKKVSSNIKTEADPNNANTDNLSTLENLYSKLTESTEVKGKLDKIFKHVRIMVVGRSGSGKTTVIRLVVGEKGPKTIAVGTAGVQDITMEWHHPDPDLPLIFHDSNGMDVLGASRLDDVKRFLDEHQMSQDFSKKIHVVWYVFSAADTRFLEDGGLLEMLDNYPNLPVLLIMTFNDHEKLVKRNVEGSRLETLLGRISDPVKRQRSRDTMVRLGNDVQQLDDGSIEGQRDLVGLKDLTQQTKALIGKELHATWIASQATDLNEKLNASAQLIISLKRSELFGTCLLGAMPVLQQTQLGYMLLAMTKGLGKIWRVPVDMEKAILREFFVSEGGQGVLKNLLYNVGAAIGLAGTITASVFTAGAATVAVLGVLVVSAFAQMKGTSALLMSYSLLVLGVILYVKALQPTRESWDDSLSLESYCRLCRDFSASEQAKQLQYFVKEYKSSWESTQNSKEQVKLLKSQLIAFFKTNVLCRPTSFFTKMQQHEDEDEDEDEDEEGHDDTSDIGTSFGHDSSDNNMADQEEDGAGLAGLMRFLPKDRKQNQPAHKFFEESDEDLYEFDEDMYKFDDL